MIHKTECIIAGAGPVGMLSALLGSSAGLNVTIIEKNRTRPKTSRAIGITPPSLEILERAGLADQFIRAGVRVRRASIYGTKHQLGSVSFDSLTEKYPFVLSIPQDKTEAILEKAVRRNKKIKLITDFTVTSVKNSVSGVTVSAESCQEKKREFTARILLACDGKRSAIRESLLIPYIGAPYKETFIMGDFKDTTDWKEDARFFFTPRGSIESFPMSGSRRRFVLRTPHYIKEGGSDYLEREIFLRSGVDLSRVKKIWESGFGVQHFEAKHFGIGRVFLCGDAAHCMSPIGGQGMNTGFADGELAVYFASQIINKSINMDEAQASYQRLRRPAYRSARKRSEMLMKLATSGGTIWSPIRNFFALTLLHSPVIRLMIPVFTMLSIPNRNLLHCGLLTSKEFRNE
jgi:2-polyprenyl-6-methoxyphenol hydroxylase-like FAD-dependent oxidoreductase